MMNPPIEVLMKVGMRKECGVKEADKLLSYIANDQRNPQRPASIDHLAKILAEIYITQKQHATRRK
jgi:hypothetical protein